MTEAFRGEFPTNELLHLEERQFILPFRDMVRFEPYDFDQADANDVYATLYEQPISFKGITGSLSIIADTNPQDNLPSVTPLGPALLTYTYTDGEIILSETPCLIEIMFEPQNMDEFDILRKYQAQFFIQDEVYALACDGDESPAFIFREFENGEDIEVADHNVKANSTGNYVNLLLPQDINKLSAIRMRICKYDDDEEDDDSITLPPYVDSPRFPQPVS